MGIVYWKKDEKKCPGNIVNSTRKKKEINSKSIPSIPTWQESYGYKYDEKNH